MAPKTVNGRFKDPRRQVECPECGDQIGAGGGPGPLVRHLKTVHGYSAEDAAESAAAVLAENRPAREVVDQAVQLLDKIERVEALKKKKTLPAKLADKALAEYRAELDELL